MTPNAEDSPANDTANSQASGGRLHDAADAVKGAASSAKSAAGDAYASTRDKVSDALGAAKEKSGAAYESARDRTADVYESAVEKATQAKTATVDAIAENPLLAFGGGLALGVLVGALLPRTRREVEALGPVASRIADGAKAAVGAATEAGRQKLDELGINADAARTKVSGLVDTAVQTATAASTAGVDAVRKPNQN